VGILNLAVCVGGVLMSPKPYGVGLWKNIRRGGGCFLVIPDLR
jgi:hypothetical protein